MYLPTYLPTYTYVSVKRRTFFTLFEKIPIVINFVYVRFFAFPITASRRRLVRNQHVSGGIKERSERT